MRIQTNLFGASANLVSAAMKAMIRRSVKKKNRKRKPSSALL
jgi:hypothetical protein